MKCPSCGSSRSDVIDSRQQEDYRWRRRKCRECEYKYSTKEVIAISGADDRRKGTVLGHVKQLDNRIANLEKALAGARREQKKIHAEVKLLYDEEIS